MSDRNFDSAQIADIVFKLCGDVRPIGETNEDNRRFKNLKVLEGLVDILLTEIWHCSNDTVYAEHSRKRSVEEAIRFLKEIHYWLCDCFKNTQWTSCKDKMPRPNELIGRVCKHYLVQDIYGDMYTAYYTGEWLDVFSSTPLIDIIAWMDLPLRYKGE